MLADGVEHGARVYFAQKDVGAGFGGDGPGMAPAVAVEHRHGPEVDGEGGHVPDERATQGAQVRAAMMSYYAFGIASSTGRIRERNGVPFILRRLPIEIRVTGGE